MNKKLLITIATGVAISVIGSVVVYKLKTSGVLGKSCDHGEVENG